MAANDYVVRRNSTGNEALPNSGSTVDSTYNTAVSSSGTSIVYADTGTFTVADHGKYLVTYSEQFGRSSSGSRINFGTWVQVNDDAVHHGFSTGFIRGSGGSLAAFSSGVAIVDVSAGSTIRVRSERSSAIGGSVARVPSRTGVTVLKLNDLLTSAAYSGPGAATTGVDNVLLNTNLTTVNSQDGTVFLQETGGITITSDNPIMFAYSMRSTDHEVADPRSEYQSVLIFDTNRPVECSWDGAYIRGREDTTWGGMSTGGVIYPDEHGHGHRLTLRVAAREGGGDTFASRLQLIELPAEAHTVFVSASSGNMNSHAVDYEWSDVPEIDPDTFTFALHDDEVEVDVSGDYLAFGSVAKTSAELGSPRAVPGMELHVDNVSTMFGASAYVRNVDTASYGAMSVAGLLTGLPQGGAISLRSMSLNQSNTGTEAVGAAGMVLVELGSILGPAGRVARSVVRAAAAVSGVGVFAPLKPMRIAGQAGVLVAGRSSVGTVRAGFARVSQVVGGLADGSTSRVAAGLARFGGLVSGSVSHSSTRVSRGVGVAAGAVSGAASAAVVRLARVRSGVAFAGGAVVSGVRRASSRGASAVGAMTATSSSRVIMVSARSSAAVAGGVRAVAARGLVVRVAVADAGRSAVVTSRAGWSRAANLVGSLSAASTTRIVESRARAAAAMTGVVSAASSRTLGAVGWLATAATSRATSARIASARAAFVTAGDVVAFTSRVVVARAAGVVSSLSAATSGRLAEARVYVVAVVSGRVRAGRSIKTIRRLTGRVVSRFGEARASSRFNRTEVE